MTMRPSLAIAAIAALLGTACSSEDTDRTWRIDFDVRVGDTPFRCGQQYPDIGTTNTTITPRDIRFFVHDAALLRANGEEVPLDLEDDREWQRDGIALLDFADDTGECATGNPALNTAVVGTAADLNDVTGVAFRIGIPAALNHIDAARGPAPLNAPGMAWSWTGGYKYARIDVTTTANPAWYIHLGATGCEGNPNTGVECAFSNLARITADGVDPVAPAVVLDMATVYAQSDLDHQIDHETDFVNGCMAFGGDPECPPIFDAMGLTFESNDAADPRAFAGE